MLPVTVRPDNDFIFKQIQRIRVDIGFIVPIGIVYIEDASMIIIGVGHEISIFGARMGMAGHLEPDLWMSQQDAFQRICRLYGIAAYRPGRSISSRQSRPGKRYMTKYNSGILTVFRKSLIQPGHPLTFMNTPIIKKMYLIMAKE